MNGKSVFSVLIVFFIVIILAIYYAKIINSFFEKGCISKGGHSEHMFECLSADGKVIE